MNIIITSFENYLPVKKEHKSAYNDIELETPFSRGRYH